MESKTIRQSNIELLRIVLIIFVLIEHYLNIDMGGALLVIDDLPITTKLLLKFNSSLSVCSVNTFFLISGFFLFDKKETSIKKPVKIIIIYLIYKLFTYILTVIFGKSDFTIRQLIACFIPNSYYAVMYAVIILFSPYLNIVTGRLSKKSCIKFVFLLVIIDSIYETFVNILMYYSGMVLNGLSSITFGGDYWGYNIVNFILMYYIGSLLRLLSLEKENIVWNHKKSIDLLCYIILSGLILLFSFVYPNIYFYSNPLVILQGCFLFLFFAKINIHSQVINFFAKSVWGIYCIHLSLNWVWVIFGIQDQIVKGFVFTLINIVLSITSMFFICVLLDRIYSIPIMFLEKMTSNLKPLNKKIVVEEK